MRQAIRDWYDRYRDRETVQPIEEIIEERRANAIAEAKNNNNWGPIYSLLDMTFWERGKGMYYFPLGPEERALMREHQRRGFTAGKAGRGHYKRPHKYHIYRKTRDALVQHMRERFPTARLTIKDVVTLLIEAKGIRAKRILRHYLNVGD
jgi:hypothetical protein